MTGALPPVLRGAALMPAAALLVHQLPYELAYGPGMRPGWRRC